MRCSTQRAIDGARALGGRRRRAVTRQQHGGDHRRTPGPEFLRRAIRAAHFAQVVVHVGGAHGARLPVLDVLEQLVSRKVEAAPQNPREPAVGERHVVLAARLAAKAQADAIAGHLDVACAKRREPEAAVVAAIALLTDAHERPIEEPDHRGQNLASWQARRREVAGDGAPDRGQPGGEVGEAVELVQVAQGAPLHVVAILAAAARVAAGRLQMAVRVAADPHRRPRRRNRERIDARDLRGVGELAALAVDVAERVGGAFAPPSCVVRPAVAQRAYDQYGRAS